MIHAETSPRAKWSPVSRSKVQGRYVGIARHAPEGDVVELDRCEGLDGFPLMGMLMCMLMCMSRPSQARKWIVSDDLQGLAPTNHRCRAAEPRPRCSKYRVLEGRIPKPSSCLSSAHSYCREVSSLRSQPSQSWTGYFLALVSC